MEFQGLIFILATIWSWSEHQLRGSFSAFTYKEMKWVLEHSPHIGLSKSDSF